MGLIQGLEFTDDVVSGDVVKAAQGEGLILIGASSNTIRFVPPLIITRGHVDEMCEKLRAAILGITEK